MRRIPVLLLLAVAFFLSASPATRAQTPEAKPPDIHAPNALPGVEPEMLSADYWISLYPDADAVIMTPAEIERFNEKNRTRQVSLDDKFGKPDPLDFDRLIGYRELVARGAYMHMIRPLDLPAAIPGDSLRMWFDTLKTWITPRDCYDNRNVIYTPEMKQSLFAEMNEGAIPDVVTRRFGIVVNHTSLRFFPTDVPGYSNTRTALDLFQDTSLLSGNPVAILHTSASGDFCYVESHLARGWAPAENIASGTREELRKLTAKKPFVMATGHRIPVYGDPKFEHFARFLYYAATMPLVKQDAKGYVVSMPYREPDGTVGTAKGYIRPGSDVHVGYLPYTKRNVLTQMFKLLNQPYGWIDQQNKRACSGTMRVLLQCFGIEVGAYPSFILPASDHVVYLDPAMSMEEKIAKAETLEGAITMGGNAGHIVLLLGKAKNGRLYFMHQAGWGFDEGNQHYIVNRTSLNPVDQKWYSIKNVAVFATFRP